MDFKSYTEIKDMKHYDGFIDPDGKFYRVKERRSNDLSNTHYTWADAFIKNNEEMMKYIMTPSYSMLYMISNLKNKQNILIHAFGYVYYSHDHLMGNPIIITPNPIHNGKEVTKEQLDTLYALMSENKEKPSEHELFLEPEEYYKSGTKYI